MPIRAAKSTAQRRQSGVTLIELMITIAVLAIFTAIAVPTFIDFRERSVIRGAAEQMVAALAQARFEAVKRDANVRVTFERGASNTAFCIGATSGSSDCDCFEKSTSAAAYCDVGMYPAMDSASSDSGQTQAAQQLRGARMSTDPTTAFGGDPTVVFEPKLGTLADLTDGGSLTFISPTDSIGYQLQLTVNALGRATLCVPSGSRAVIGYKSC